MDLARSEQRLKNLLRQVAQQGASDLHLVVGRYPTLRIDGKLFPLTQESMLTPEDTQALSRALNVSEESKKVFVQEGSLDFSYNFEEKIRFRTNVFFQKGYVSITMRLVNNKIKTLEELNMPAPLYEFAKHSQGLVLVTGPVGHGKSTTLAAILDYINHGSEGKNIITIEDPIEYVFEQDQCIINQREIGQDVVSFSTALRSVFREDANVIMIGEMRDLDTISTVMTAAETGHLIFATLHTNDSSQTIDRIVDVFPAYQQNQIRLQLSNVLLGVISQRLLPRIGGGRVPAVEVMFNNKAVGNLIRENKTYQLDSVIETGMKENMVSLDRSLSELVKRGLVTIDDALAYARDPSYLHMMMKK